uniref:VWFA domain-containing protein n=1 Tax=Periophthalmus magnuspinnatus TaxID=409849 RepID=A0A3B4BD01_9GOBI
MPFSDLCYNVVSSLKHTWIPLKTFKPSISYCMCRLLLSLGSSNKHPLELVFIIDSSESVGPENFELVKDFMVSLMERLSISRQGAHVGLLLYSHINMVIKSLQQQADQEHLRALVRRMPYLGEGTFTGSAIHGATRLFEEARPGVRRVAVLLTDGQADPRDAMQFEETATRAHEAGIEIFVIGMLNHTDPLYAEFEAEMSTIASEPAHQHIYLIDDYRTLPSKAHSTDTQAHRHIHHRSSPMANHQVTPNTYEDECALVMWVHGVTTLEEENPILYLKIKFIF